MNFSDNTQAWLIGAGAAVGAVAAYLSNSAFFLPIATIGLAAVLSVLLVHRFFPMPRWGLLLVLVLDLFLSDLDLDPILNHQLALGLKLAVYLLAFVVAISYARTITLRPVLLPLLYALWCLLTITRSPDVGYSLPLIGVMLTQAFVAFVATQQFATEPPQLWLAIGVAELLKLLLTIGLLLLAPHLAWMAYRRDVPAAPGWLPRLGGDLLGPNGLGFDAAIVALICLGLGTYLHRTRILRIGYIAAVGTLLLSQSRSSLAAWAAGHVVLDWRLKRRRAMAFLLMILALGSWAIFKKHQETLLLISRGEGISAVESLEGRKGIWEYVILRTKEHPWLGHGYGSTPHLLGLRRLPGAARAVESAHNTWLESLLTVGIPGTLLLAALFLQGLIGFAVKTGKRDIGSSLGGVLLIALILRGLAESTVANGGAHDTLIFFTSYFATLGSARRSN